MNSEPSDHYKDRVSALDNVVRDCISVSQACAGIRSATGSHYFASVLFTSLCTRAVSIAVLAPYSPWSNKIVEHWDYASIASLTRALLEIRLAFFYLCAEPCSDDEWQCRWNIFNIHDCQSRLRLFSELPDPPEDVSGFQEQLNELQGRLTANVFFATIASNQQKQFLNGNRAYLHPLEEIANRAGVDLHTFRWLYKFLSSHVHGLPMAFYRMGVEERGRGVHSDTEEDYTSLCLSFVVSLLVRSRDEMKQKFGIPTEQDQQSAQADGPAAGGPSA
ncbi:DUF5677 domain-containing protein [Candidatus Thiodiazotropha sp. CDECU1]|uniref:DUF5677 domain-containing protein n=1 Tax=Candidatus Thiodiazotropha sp. CDECU1 TaxID=3065865 RepID=UPI00292DC2B2|nr:DUF5677 domain-containing protein [Candidatus Thiodiazotropha sp. CDECU1]